MNRDASIIPVQPSILSGGFRAESVCSSGVGGTIEAVFMPPADCNASSVRQLFAKYPDMTVRDLLTRVEKYTSERQLGLFCRITTKSHEWRLVLSTSENSFRGNHRLFSDLFPVKYIPDWLFSNCRLLIDSTGREGERGRRNNKLEDKDLGSGYVTPNDVIKSTKTSAEWEMNEVYNEWQKKKSLQERMELTGIPIGDMIRNVKSKYEEYQKKEKEYLQLCAEYPDEPQYPDELTSYEYTRNLDKLIKYSDPQTHRLYDIIGLRSQYTNGQKPTREQIKKAIRRQILQSHPDTGGTDDTFREIRRASKVLLNDESRAIYDEEGDWARFEGRPQAYTRFDSIIPNPYTI